MSCQYNEKTITEVNKTNIYANYGIIVVSVFDIMTLNKLKTRKVQCLDFCKLCCICGNKKVTESK